MAEAAEATVAAVGTAAVATVAAVVVDSVEAGAVEAEDSAGQAFIRLLRALLSTRLPVQQPEA